MQQPVHPLCCQKAKPNQGAKRAAAHPCASVQDVDLKSYARMACRMVDIHTGASPVEALHTLFSLFLLFKASPEHQQRHLFDAVEHELE